jgi:ATP-dependent DNA helicase RecG
VDAAPVLDLLKKLDVVSADALETQTLDFKEWDRRGMKMAVEAVIEHVVCMANGGGGILIIGVHDKRVGRAQAIIGVPPEVDINALRKSIYDKTRPQIMASVVPLSVPEGSGRILIIDVKGEFPPYTDSQGSAKIRVNRECLRCRCKVPPAQYERQGPDQISRERAGSNLVFSCRYRSGICLIRVPH